MKISEVAHRSGVLATTIRFYESIGVLPAPHRVNGQRVYGPDVLDRLAVIRFGLHTGFSLNELKMLFLEFGSRTRRRTAAQGRLKELSNLRERVKFMERFLKEIRLCACGTIQQVAARLVQSGALGDGDVVSASPVIKEVSATRLASRDGTRRTRDIRGFSPAAINVKPK